jgi:hypothetical protein
MGNEMNPRPPRPATRKAGRKRPKLTLNKETLRDLTAAHKEIKGGAPVETGVRCNINGNATNGCES